MSTIFDNNGFVSSSSRTLSSLECDNIQVTKINADTAIRGDPLFITNVPANTITDPSISGIPTAFTEASTPINLTPAQIRQGVIRLNGAAPIVLVFDGAAAFIDAIQGKVGDSVTFVAYDIGAAPPVHGTVIGGGFTLSTNGLGGSFSNSIRYVLTVLNNSVGTEEVLVSRP